MKPVERLLLENKAWAAEKLAQDAHYFQKLQAPRTPDIFWIGCSDSRVHADEITQTEPGEIFVHRNIANQVSIFDVNFLAALEYAVFRLGVRHVVVCGHYGCGGVRAALDKSRPTELYVTKWLKPIKDTYRQNALELDRHDDALRRLERLVDLNVIEQVKNLSHSSVIQQIWRRELRPDLHGWVYRGDDGIIKEIVHRPAGSAIDPLYEFDFETS